MLNKDDVLSVEKKDLMNYSKLIERADLPVLVGCLSEKDDIIRYQALLLLQYRSEWSSDVYQFWDVFCSMLARENSYQRSIGLILIAENIRWDKDDKIAVIIDAFLELVNDDKPITSRQCIQALTKIIQYKPQFNRKIAEKLMGINLMDKKETMRKLILIDILNVLIFMRRVFTTDEIENYINNALTGGILDKKSIKQIEALYLN